MKESVDTLITTNENIMLLKSKQKMSLRNYAVSLVKRMSKGTPDENVAEQDIVFTEFYQFPNDYPSAINKMDSISHSFRVTFSSPSGVEYFFHVVTPTYKLVNLKLPPKTQDELEIAGTNGSYIDTGVTSLESLNAADLCLPIKIDSSGDGRFEK